MKKYLLILIGAASIGTAAYAQQVRPCPAGVPIINAGTCIRRESPPALISCSVADGVGLFYFNTATNEVEQSFCRSSVSGNTQNEDQVVNPIAAPALFSYAGFMHALGLAPTATPTAPQPANAMYAHTITQPATPANIPTNGMMPIMERQMPPMWIIPEGYRQYTPQMPQNNISGPGIRASVTDTISPTANIFSTLYRAFIAVINPPEQPMTSAEAMHPEPAPAPHSTIDAEAIMRMMRQVPAITPAPPTPMIWPGMENGVAGYYECEANPEPTPIRTGLPGGGGACAAPVCFSWNPGSEGEKRAGCKQLAAGAFSKTQKVIVDAWDAAVKAAQGKSDYKLNPPIIIDTWDRNNGLDNLASLAAVCTFGYVTNNGPLQHHDCMNELASRIPANIWNAIKDDLKALIDLRNQNDRDIQAAIKEEDRAINQCDADFPVNESQDCANPSPFPPPCIGE